MKLSYIIVPFALSIMAPLAAAKEAPVPCTLPIGKIQVLERTIANCCAFTCDCGSSLRSR